MFELSKESKNKNTAPNLLMASKRGKPLLSTTYVIQVLLLTRYYNQISEPCLKSQMPQFSLPSCSPPRLYSLPPCCSTHHDLQLLLHLASNLRGRSTRQKMKCCFSGLWWHNNSLRDPREAGQSGVG